MLVFFYEYLVNIPGLFYNLGDKDIENYPIYKDYYGIVFKYPQMEVALFTLTLFFFILLIP